MAANISAKEVQALREKTGVGMMDCKKALVANDGDMEKAIVYLREKGLAASVKKSTRIAAEGVIAIYNENNTGVLVEVNAETDFVAKNEKFIAFANNVALVVANDNPSDMDGLLNCKYPDSDMTVEDMRKEMVFVIGENIQIRRFARIEGNISSYNHGNGKIGVLAQFSSDASSFGKNVCMQIASMSPRYLSREDVPADVLESEKSILIAQIKNDPKTANKPDQVIEKMVNGKIGKFYTENCLLDQEYFIDPDLTVGKFIESNGDAKILSYIRFERGEGLQKREDNFADEVAKMTQK